MGLTTDRVVAEAAVVADEVGLERLTLASVAKRLGVSLPGLYKHIENMDGLRRDLAVLGVRELTTAMSAAAAGRAGRDALHAVANAYRAYAREHPGRCAASIRAPEPDDAEHNAVGAAAVGILASVLSAYRIDGDDAIDAIRCLRVALHGFVTLESAGGFGLPQSVDATFTRLIDALDTAYVSWSIA
ncbi:MAG TPA: TetR-like C-terminal domain-containing protein [Micromonosporaceae bacterium]|jgi:AcrR family transcriptional regulator